MSDYLCGQWAQVAGASTMYTSSAILRAPGKAAAIAEMLRFLVDLSLPLEVCEVVNVFQTDVY